METLDKTGSFSFQERQNAAFRSPSLTVGSKMTGSLTEVYVTNVLYIDTSFKIPNLRLEIDVSVTAL